MSQRHIFHVEGCGHSVEMHLPPKGEAPDPDAWGNISVRGTCKGCGARCVVTSGLHAPTTLSRGFKLDREVEWAVPLP